MNGGRLCSVLLASALLAGCVGDWQRSYERWRGYEESSGPYSRWARCVRDRSYRYLDLDALPAAPRPAGEPIAGNDSQRFTHVLADCRELMSGPAWEALSDEDMRKLLADAYRAFARAGADIADRRFREIISETQD